MTATDRTVAGQPVDVGVWLGRAEGEVVPISVEEGLARELNVGIGDPILWDVQGRALATRVAHLREVEWARFETNFFVVFPEGPLAQAPQTYVTMTRVDDTALRVAFQRRIA